MSDRDFKGVWIPKVVWLDDRLNALEKIILAEIDSLDNGERGCFASNKHIADFCQCSEAKVSKSVTKLVKLGYLYIQNFDGRQRELKSSLSKMQGRLVKNTRQSSKKCKADSQNLQESNTDNNTNNNTLRNKKERKAASYDEILSSVAIDELRDLYTEYIKMRKFIKSPMTDRALTMLINKVNELEPYSVERQKKLLETAIMNNWKSVYPLKDKPKEKHSSFNTDDFFSAAAKRSALDREVIKRAEEKAPPKTAANDEGIRSRMEALQNKLKEQV